MDIVVGKGPRYWGGSAQFFRYPQATCVGGPKRSIYSYKSSYTYTPRDPLWGYPPIPWGSTPPRGWDKIGKKRPKKLPFNNSPIRDKIGHFLPNFCRFFCHFLPLFCHFLPLFATFRAKKRHKNATLGQKNATKGHKAIHR